MSGAILAIKKGKEDREKGPCHLLRSRAGPAGTRPRGRAAEARLGHGLWIRARACQSGRIAPVSHGTALSGVSKVEHQSEACANAFWLVARRSPWFKVTHAGSASV